MKPEHKNKLNIIGASNMRTRNVYPPLVIALMLTAVVQAVVPEPDAVLYGTITIDGTQATASDEVMVIARVTAYR